jgi:hypothetical protein
MKQQLGYHGCYSGLEDPGSNFDRSKGFFYSPKQPDRLWSTHRLTPKGFEVLSWM